MGARGSVESGEAQAPRQWGKIALAAVGVLVLVFAGWKVFALIRGTSLEFQGQILKVRTLYADDAHSIAVVDFQITNQADYPFMIRQVDLSVVTPDGKAVAGTPIADMDAQRLFDNYESLGKREHEGLLMKQTVSPHQTTARMVAAQFDIAAADIRRYKEVVITFHEMDGVSTVVRGRAP